MKKIDFSRFRLKKAGIHELDDRMLLLNLYMTQLVVLLIAGIIFLFQKPDFKAMLSLRPGAQILIWGLGFAWIVLAVELLIFRWVPEEVADDGGINEKLFARRPLWHIVWICLLVSICEELLFRGAIQAAWGPYWTSILFAAIHVRYLRHWLMTGLVFSISYGLGWIYLRTGSLWTPIAAHFAIDLVMGCILRYRRE